MYSSTVLVSFLHRFALHEITLQRGTVFSLFFTWLHCRIFLGSVSKYCVQNSLMPCRRF